MPPGMMPAATIRGDAVGAGLDRLEAEEHAARRLRLLQDAHGDLGDDAEQALRTDHEAEQVEAFRIEMTAAEADDLATDQHHLDAEYVVGGQAVFQAVHAAGVLGDVAADRAGDLRGSEDVVEAAVFDGAGDREIGDAGLDAGAASSRNRRRGCGLNLAMPSRMPSASGEEPPRQRGSRAARGTTLTFSAARRMIATTSSTVSGRATTSGFWRYMVSASHSQGRARARDG